MTTNLTQTISDAIEANRQYPVSTVYVYQHDEDSFHFRYGQIKQLSYTGFVFIAAYKNGEKIK